MKYHKHTLLKVYDSDVDDGHYFEIYNEQGKYITSAWTLSNAKEFVDSFDGKTYNYNVLA